MPCNLREGLLYSAYTSEFYASEHNRVNYFDLSGFDSNNTETPKSAYIYIYIVFIIDIPILSTPSLSNNTFYGFKSLWTTPLACTYHSNLQKEI